MFEILVSLQVQPARSGNSRRYFAKPASTYLERPPRGVSRHSQTALSIILIVVAARPWRGDTSAVAGAGGLYLERDQNSEHNDGVRRGSSSSLFKSSLSGRGPSARRQVRIGKEQLGLNERWSSTHRRSLWQTNSIPRPRTSMPTIQSKHKS